MTSTRTHNRHVLFAAMLLLGMESPVHAETPNYVHEPVLAPEVAPPYTLFMGVELAVQREGILMPVRDVQGSSIIAKRNNKQVQIPTTGKSLNLKVNRSLKVAKHSAMLDRLEVERTYTAANDPFRKFAVEAGAVAGADAVASLELGKLTDALVSQGFVENAAAHGQPADVAAASARVDRAVRNYSDVTYKLQAQATSAGEAANEYTGDRAAEQFDALWISFKVSAPEPLLQAYVVVLAQLRAGEKTKAQQYNWVYAKALGRVDAKPQPVYIKQGGFPPGYVLERCEVHLFNEGEEIATNESPMRVELSRDEAFQYAAVEYITRHKGATLPADLAGGQNTEKLRAYLDSHYKGAPVYVSVSKDGLARGVFRDKAGQSPLVDESLLELLRNLRFNPAISDGKPRDSLVKVMAQPDAA